MLIIVYNVKNTVIDVKKYQQPSMTNANDCPTHLVMLFGIQNRPQFDHKYVTIIVDQDNELHQCHHPHHVT